MLEQTFGGTVCERVGRAPRWRLTGHLAMLHGLDHHALEDAALRQVGDKVWDQVRPSGRPGRRRPQLAKMIQEAAVKYDLRRPSSQSMASALALGRQLGRYTITKKSAVLQIWGKGCCR